jgi:hypothetical protein
MKLISLRVASMLLMVLWLSPAGAHAQTGSPAAVLTSCKGVVSVIHSGASAPASFGAPLSDGDEVKTGAGGEAEIMFSDGNWVQIGPNSSMKIKGRPVAAPGEKAPEAENKATNSGHFEVVQSFLKLKNAEGTSSVGTLRAIDKPAVLEPVSPSQTRLRTSRPVFLWKNEDKDLELRFTLYGQRAIVWKSDISGVTSLTYPADAPELKSGIVYSWTVETTDPLVSPPLRSQASFFEVLAPADVKMLDTDLSKLDANKPGPVTYHLTRASIYFDRGLVDDAIKETEAALSSDPANASLHTILGRLYAEAGRTHDALNELNKSQQ